MFKDEASLSRENEQSKPSWNYKSVVDDFNQDLINQNKKIVIKVLLK